MCCGYRVGVEERGEIRQVILVRGEMEYLLHAFESLLPRRPPPHVAVNELNVTRRHVIGQDLTGMHGRQQRIEDPDLISSEAERVNRVGADESRAARDKYSHVDQSSGCQSRIRINSFCR